MWTSMNTTVPREEVGTAFRRTPSHVSSGLGKGECVKFVRSLLPSYRGKRLLVIHERAEQPKGSPVEAMGREAQGRLELKPHPAYSPELNPEERIWKWRRHVVTHHRRLMALREELQTRRAFFCYLAGRKEQVRQLCGIKTPESLLALL